MSPHTLDALIDELQQFYKAVLLQISHKLENNQKEELRFYCSDVIVAKEDTRALNILLSLQDTGKVSWKDVCFLKEGLCVIQRIDLVNTLTAFEVTRNLIVLLDFYARKSLDSESHDRRAFQSVETMAGYLMLAMADVARSFNVHGAVEAMLQSRMGSGMKKILVDLEEEIDRQMSDPWSKMAFLVVITGEMIAVTLATDEERTERHQKEETLIKFCFTAADKLSSRMIKLGSWVSL